MSLSLLLLLLLLLFRDPPLSIADHFFFSILHVTPFERPELFNKKKWLENKSIDFDSNQIRIKFAFAFFFFLFLFVGGPLCFDYFEIWIFFCIYFINLFSNSKVKFFLFFHLFFFFPISLIINQHILEFLFSKKIWNWNNHIGFRLVHIFFSGSKTRSRCWLFA